MSSISLNSRARLSSPDESQHLLHRFHLDRHTLASPTVANRFVCKALNGFSGLRYVDTNTSFRLVQHALGSSTERTFDLIGFSQATLDIIAECVNAELDAYVSGRKTHSILVFQQKNEGVAIRLIPALGKNALFTKMAGDMTLLIPTGMTSSVESGGESVYLRLDVVRSWRKKGALMTAKEFLFTNSAGKSIAGLGDIPDTIVNIDDAHDALKEVLGIGYNVSECNARIFDAWWQHKRLDGGGDSIVITLPASNLTERKAKMVLRRTSSTAWEMLLNDGTGTRPLAAYVSAFDVEIDIESLSSECKHVKNALSNLNNVVGVTNFDHVFGDHPDRLPEAFRTLIQADYEKAKDRFIEALKQSKATPLEWQPVPYHCGNEKKLEHNGDVAFTRIQLLLPLYLTDEDRKYHSASVYAVVGLKRDPITNAVSCFVPTILDTTM